MPEIITLGHLGLPGVQQTPALQYIGKYFVKKILF